MIKKYSRKELEELIKGLTELQREDEFPDILISYDLNLNDPLLRPDLMIIINKYNGTMVNRSLYEFTLEPHDCVNLMDEIYNLQNKGYYLEHYTDGNTNINAILSIDNKLYIFRMI